MTLTHHTIDPRFQQLLGTIDAVLESVAQSITLIGADRIVYGLNSLAQRETKAIFGREMQIGDSIDRYVLPHNQENFAANFARALQGERVCVELSFADTTGAARWYEFIYAPIMAEDGAADATASGICFTVRNVTDQHKAAESIKSLSEQNQLILEAVSEGVIGLDQEGVCIFINRAATEILRTTANAEIGGHFHELHHLSEAEGAHLSWDACPIRATLRDGQTRCERAAHYKRADGSVVYVDLVSTPQLAQGQVVGATLTLRDVSSQLAAEAALRQSEERFRGIVEQSYDGITLTNEAGAVIVWNSAMTRITGLAADAVLGRPMWQVQYELGTPAEHTRQQLTMIKALTQSTLATGQSPWANHTYERVLHRADGQVRIVASTMFAVPSGSGFLLAGILRDVTEARRTQQALSESEQRLNLALEASTDAIYDWDLDTNRLYWSPRFAQMLGYEPDELQPSLEQWLQLMHDGDRPRAETVFGEYRQGTRSSHDLEYRLRTKTGAYRWLLSRGKTITLRTPAGAVAQRRLLGAHTDISESKLASEMLVARNLELTTLFQISEILLTDRPLETICDEVINALLTATGMLAGAIQISGSISNNMSSKGAVAPPVDDQTAAGAQQFAAPFDAALVQAVIASGKPRVQVQAGAAPQTVLVVPMHVDERLLGVLSLAHPDMTFVPDHLLNLVQNVANLLASTIERRRATATLHERVREVNCLYEVTRLLQSASLDLGATMQQVAAILPAGLRFPAFADAQITVDNHSATSDGALPSAGRWHATAQIIVNGVARGQVRVTYRDTKLSGAAVPFLPEEHALLAEIAQRLALFVERYDNLAQLMAERASLEERVAERTAQLAAANAELARAARMKDEFLASMSHELRTPLTGILGLSEALQMAASGPLTERQSRSVRLIESSGRHLLELINDILDVAKIEAGKIELQIEPVAVGSLNQSCLQMVREMAATKRQQIVCTVQPPDLIVAADRRRLKQMLVNLLSNAVKFTGEDGRLGIDVTVSAADQAVYFTVWDTGIGIAAADLPRLFQPFVQLDSRLSRQYAGTGLGLTLVQRMAALHGGSVSVESILGQGARFTIILPWTPQPDALHALAPAARDDGWHDDVPQTSRMRLLASILRKVGAVPLVQPATAPLFDQITLLQPDLILLAEERAGGAAQWPALSSNPLTSGVPLLSAGVAASDLPKSASRVHPLPQFFTIGELTAAIRHIFPHGDRLRILVVGEPTLRPRILLVEDNEATQQLLCEFLEGLAYTVMTAGDGATAIQLAMAAPPDIVLMDVQMPGMDGLEAMRQIRSLPVAWASQIPIVVVTALAMPGDAERCIAAGANAYVRKPFKLPEIAEVVEKWLGGEQGM